MGGPGGANRDIRSMFGPPVKEAAGAGKRPLEVEEGALASTSKRRKVEGSKEDTEHEALSEELGGSSKESRNARFLADLSLEDAKALYRVMLGEVSTVATSPLKPADAARLAAMRSSGQSGRDGRWYTDRVTCLLSQTKSINNSHPRWQFKLDGGPSSVAGKIRRAISSRAWETLSSLSNAMKISQPHVSYNADDRRVTAPLPLNVGAGGSVSHLCDVKGCIKQSHLEATPNHIDNMGRQRCAGIVLLCFRGVIVQEVPCSHGKALSIILAEQLLRSCTRVQILDVSEEVFNLMASIPVSS